MNVQHKDFIGFYQDVFPDGYCQFLIDEFERLDSGGAGISRKKGEGALKHSKNDQQIHINVRAHRMRPFNNNTDTVDMFFEGLQKCYEEYSENYSVLQTTGNVRGTAMKMQRTDPGGGYHVWHCEQGSGLNANRAVVYMLYLNTLADSENGETEFLYQQQRVRTKENLMLLWPAAYTHAHRGNPVYGQNSKYIVTGWFYYD